MKHCKDDTMADDTETVILSGILRSVVSNDQKKV